MYLYYRWKGPTLDSDDSKVNLEFLKAAAALIDDWPKASNPANIFTPDTRKVVLLTSRNTDIVDILQKYICTRTGAFSTSALES